MARRTLAACTAALGIALQALAASAAEPMRVVQILRGGGPGIEGLDGPKSVAVSPDGRHVYVVSLDGSLAVFERHAASGRLREIETYWNGRDGVVGLDDPIAVVVSQDGENVYAVSADPPAVVAFTRDATSGALAFLNAVTEGLYCPSLDEWPYTPYQPRPCPRFAALTPDDTKLLILGGGEFERDPTTGSLGPQLPFPINSYWDFAQSADGRYIYQAISFWRDGELNQAAIRPSGEAEGWTEGPQFGSWYRARISADGLHMYGVNRSPDVRRMCWADVDPENGEVGPQACREERMAVAYDSEVAADGSVYVCNGPMLLRYEPDPVTGALGAPDVLTSSFHFDIATSPDSRNVYMIMYQADLLTVVPESSTFACAITALALLQSLAFARRPPRAPSRDRSRSRRRRSRRVLPLPRPASG